MTLKSMTGYGRGEAAAHGWKAEVELSTVNRRQLDIRVNLPRTLQAMESLVAGAIHAKISRGFVSVTVRIAAASSAARGAVTIDTALARTLVKAIRRTADELGLDGPLTPEVLFSLPDVIQRRTVPEDVEQVWPMVRRALRSAVNDLIGMREEEGRALGRDMGKRLKALRRIAVRIRRRAPSVTRQYREALVARLREFESSLSADEQAIHREVAIFADRSDISEELVRLDSHFNQAFELLEAVKPVGRTLDFLCQEMFREINTIGSKANDAAITRAVIEFKTDLETIREQVQNVE